MEKVKLDEIDLENSFFHFTNALNIELINKYGLLPTIGESSKGLEITKKIFFAKGTDGALKICDVWIKLLMNRMNNYYSLTDKYNGFELDEKAREWEKKFLSRDYLNDEVKKREAFKKMFNDMKSRKYLILDLKEGIDFSYNDIDEVKEYSLQNKRENPNNKNYKYIKEFYGSYSNVDVATVETWNMHAYTGKNILPSQIAKLTTSEGRENALDILVEIYDKYRNADIEFDMLDEFIEIAKQKIKEEGREETKFHPEEISELLRRNGFESLVIKLGQETLAEQNATFEKDRLEDEMKSQEREIDNKRDEKTVF